MTESKQEDQQLPHAEEPIEMTGAQMIWAAFEREGVDVVFGHPGGAILPAYDALSPYEASGRIHHVLVRHEQSAGHMADGYARATGRVGVCIVTSGPAATNLVTGLATALMDSVPIVAVTGQVPTFLLGTDAFQESDVVGVTQPVCKHNYLVTDIADLPLILKEAFYIAREGRPGPVLVDICKDVQNATGAFRYDMEIDLPGFEPWPKVDGSKVDQAAEMINQAERPLIIAGHGIQLSGTGAGAAGVGREGRHSGGHHAVGRGRHPGDASAQSRHGRHARRGIRQPCDPGLRRAHRLGHAF